MAYNEDDQNFMGPPRSAMAATLKKYSADENDPNFVGPPSSAAPEDKPMDPDLKRKLGLAAIGILTPLIGGVFGGSQGALAGGSAGLGAVGKTLDTQNQRDYEAKKVADALKVKQADEEKKRAEGFEDFKAKENYKKENKPPEQPKTYSVGGQIVQQGPDGSFTPVYTSPTSAASTSANPKELNKARVALSNDLDPNKARGGNLAKNQDLVNQADRLKTLVTSVPDGNLDQRQQEELAIGLNRLLSGSSSSAVSQVKALVPSTAIGNAQKLKEWLFNDPQGVNQQAFVKRMAETVDREREVAQQKVVQAQVQRIAAHKWLRDNDPETYNQILSSYGIDPNKIDEKGQYQFEDQTGGNKAGNANANQLSGEDLQAIEWAKANPKDPRAQQILKLHGVQ